MTDVITMIIILIAGAIGGLIRTITEHNGVLIFPSVNIKGRRFRLGFIASLLLGSVAAFFVDFGVITILPTQDIDNIWTAMLVGLSAGFLSLHILNKILGLKIDDPDVCEFGSTTAILEPNVVKREMYEAIYQSVSGVERLLISDEQVAGVMKVIVVPKVGADATDIKISVESVINKIRHPGIQVYVYTPDEVPIDIELEVVIKNGEHNRQKIVPLLQSRISTEIGNYINSLQPGESVLHSQIVHLVIKLDRKIDEIIIKDAPGDKIISTPPFHRGRIPIGSFQVARFNSADVKVVFKTLDSLS